MRRFRLRSFRGGSGDGVSAISSSPRIDAVDVWASCAIERTLDLVRGKSTVEGDGGERLEELLVAPLALALFILPMFVVKRS